MNGRPRGRVDFRTWSLRVVGWDGILPFVVASFPFGIDMAFPNNPRLIDVVGVALPIVACRSGFLLDSITSGEIRVRPR